jgi:hypothetical protein
MDISCSRFPDVNCRKSERPAALEWHRSTTRIKTGCVAHNLANFIESQGTLTVCTCLIYKKAFAKVIFSKAVFLRLDGVGQDHREAGVGQLAWIILFASTVPDAFMRSNGCAPTLALIKSRNTE